MITVNEIRVLDFQRSLFDSIKLLCRLCTLTKCVPQDSCQCTLSPSTFGEILERELHETRLCNCDSLHCCHEILILGRDTRRSQARHETLWLAHHGPLKKRELTKRDTSAQGYTRASEVRRVFPSTFSLSRCLGFSQCECTADITNWKKTYGTK